MGVLDGRGRSSVRWRPCSWTPARMLKPLPGPVSYWLETMGPWGLSVWGVGMLQCSWLLARVPGQPGLCPPANSAWFTDEP